MEEELLKQLYLSEKKSVYEIAQALICSQSKVNYWFEKHGIKKRSIAEAVYTKRNPTGDPFSIPAAHARECAFMFGLGLGLYWGEGTKKSRDQVRLGNSDPYLIRSFILFLRTVYKIDESRLRFALQIFSDMDQVKEEKFWRMFLNVSAKQFYKTINTRSGSIGTYRTKSKHGVLTVYFNNKKLRDVLVSEIEKMQQLSYYESVRDKPR